MKHKLIQWQTLALVFAVFLALSMVVSAENDTTTTSSADTAKQALDIRYAHLVCKTDFANTQTALIDKYLDASPALLSANQNVQQDIETLSDLKDANNLTAFDTYLEETFKENFQTLNEEIKDAKKDFKTYNSTNTSKEAFKTELKDAVKVYSECVSAKEIAMSKVALKHYTQAQDKWAKELEKMNKKNISTQDVELIKTDMEAKLEQLEAYIDAGNYTAAKLYLQEIKQSQFHYWARLEQAKLKGYIEKIEPIAQKHGKSVDTEKIKERIEELDKYTTPGYRYQKGDSEKVWEELKESSKELRETSKELLKQEIEAKKAQRETEREQKKQAFELEKEERERQREMNRNSTSDDDLNDDDNDADVDDAGDEDDDTDDTEDAEDDDKATANQGNREGSSS